MEVSEIFHSIQGEGELAGMPSAFVRISGCNLRCAWCDTRHTSWEPEGAHMTVDAIMARIEPYPTMYCVITGGEPTLDPDLPELTRRLKASGRHITIESNGTCFQEGVLCDLFSMSPKLRNSVPDPLRFPREAALHRQWLWNGKAFRRWVDGYAVQIKFVVSEESDLQDIHDWLARLERTVPPCRILLMPEGTDEETLRRRGPRVAELAKRHGFRFCPRLHIELYGNTRGA
jgi:7-carboxy-7-deazaguanine synthase